MSEQWWAVKVGKKYYDLCTDQKRAQAYASEWGENYLGVEAVPVRIVEDAGPCPWELSQFGDSQPYKNEKDWISFISQYGWRWCPMCGRSLKEE